MTESIVSVSRQFFAEILLPILRRDFPAETAATAFGVFGYGSEVMGMDDEYSSDHHWGIRINAVMPDALYQGRGRTIAQAVLPHMPESYQGYDVRAGFSGGTGLSITGLESYLKTTIGIDHAPVSYADWLGAPEEDIIHIVNGELWLDETGRFTHVRHCAARLLPGAGAPAAHRPLVPLLFRHGQLRAQAGDPARQRVLRHDRLFPRRALGGAARLHAGTAVLPLRQVDLRLLPPAAAALRAAGVRWWTRPCALPLRGSASWNCSTAWPT
jgi:hypothetical protein